MTPTDKKEIKIDSDVILALLVSSLLGIFTVFSIEHFGEFNINFNVKANGVIITDEPLNYFQFSSPFGNIIRDYNEDKYDYWDFKMKGGKWHTYENKSVFYYKSAMQNYSYAIMFAAIYFIIYLFFKRFRIKII